jgi:hypothetical protein
MIVGWSPTSPEQTADLASGVVNLTRTQANSLLRDVDLVVVKRLVSSAIFDLKYFGSLVLQPLSYFSDDSGVIYGVDTSFNICNIDPFLGVVDTGLNTAGSINTIGASLLAPGEAVFWSGVATNSATTATRFHTNFSAVATISNGAAGVNVAPGQYRYSGTFGRYYRLATTASARQIQTATSVGGSWTILHADAEAVDIAVNTGYPYVVSAHFISNQISLRIFSDDDLIQSWVGVVAGPGGSYVRPHSVWFWKDRLYMVASTLAATAWAVIRSAPAPGSTDLSANLVDFEVVFEMSGLGSPTPVPGPSKFLNTFTHATGSDGRIYWSPNGFNWFYSDVGSGAGAAAIAGNRLITKQSMSRAF